MGKTIVKGFCFALVIVFLVMILTSSSGYIRPVLYLVDDALYVSGDGTIENPYIIK